MKQFCLLLFCFGVCRVSFSQSSIPEEWKVSPSHAQQMIEYFGSCEKCPSSKATPDKQKEDSIRAMFPNAKSITWENARYTKEDVVRYALRKGVNTKSAASQVKGYSTQLLKVVDADDTEHFFDIVSICPPPAGCDGGADTNQIKD